MVNRQFLNSFNSKIMMAKYGVSIGLILLGATMLGLAIPMAVVGIVLIIGGIGFLIGQ